MRLCGISSRFQLLSPGIRQVTHALLTRPPLTFKSLGFIKSPFDLHVLSTPPAFILSQDQTLVLKCLNRTRLTLANLSRFTVIWVVFYYSVFAFTLAVIVLLRKADDYLIISKIFRVALLFDCQGSVALFLSQQ